MNKNIFELGLSFHKELIRATLSQATIDNAEKFLVNGDESLPGIGAQSRSRAKSFAATITGRIDMLKKWHAADVNEQRGIYKASHKRAPADGTFNAVMLVLHDDLKTGTAASTCGVNFQTVKVLIPRIQRYNEYAENLNSLTKENLMPGTDPDGKPKT